MRTRLIALLPVLFAAPAWAQGHGVTVVNGAGEAIRSIVISAQPGSGENRLRSSLPPGASGRITYNTGCQANVRIGFDSGRTEDHANVDICSDPRLQAGSGSPAPAASAAAPPTTAPGSKTPAAGTKTVAVNPNLPVKAPPPVVPPWTGKSITKRFGGMD